MTIDEYTVFTRDRTEFQKLMSFLARAIDTKFLHDAGRIPLIFMAGEPGKSLAAESMMKTWSDEYSLRDAVQIEPDDKMFLEKSPSDAIHPVSMMTQVAGKPSKIVFTSSIIYKPEILDHRFRQAFSDATTGGAMIFSNAAIMFSRNFIDSHRQEKAAVLMSLRFDFPSGKTDHSQHFERITSIRIHDEQLWNSTRFQTYWSDIDGFRRPARPARANFGL